jgi:hypothetical protein
MLLIRLAAYDAFVLKNSLKRLSRGEWTGKRTTSREQHTLASQVVQEQCVPGLHRPVGEQHIDFTRGIEVQRARIDDDDRPSRPSRNTQADTRQLHQLLSSSVPPKSSSSNSSS